MNGSVPSSKADRGPPPTVRGRPLHQVDLAYHWGINGYGTGDAAGESAHMALDHREQAGVDERTGTAP